MKHWINIITCFILCQQVSKSAKLENIQHGKFLTNSIEGYSSVYTFETLLKVSVEQCIKACSTTKSCEYMNYERHYTKCDLLRMEDDSETLNVNIEVKNKPGCVFGNKSEWTEISNICNHCKNYGACTTTTKNENIICRNSGCGKPNGHFIKGNMLSHGNMIMVNNSNCSNGEMKLIRRHHVNASVCLEEGTWSHPYICLNGSEFKGSFYYIHTQVLNWHGGKDYCESLYGHLVDINTEEEQHFLESILVGGYRHGMWTGGNDFLSAGDFRWSDGSAMKYTFWFPGEPDYDTQCVEIDGGNKFYYYGWTDRSCIAELMIICEIENL